MKNNISISQHSKIESIKNQWLVLDKIAENKTSAYINYTYYQTYEWNYFIAHHSTDGLGILTTIMRYDLITVDHWCLLKMFNINFIFFKHNTLGFGYAVRALKWLTLRPVLNRSKYAYR